MFLFTQTLCVCFHNEGSKGDPLCPSSKSKQNDLAVIAHRSYIGNGQYIQHVICIILALKLNLGH